MVDMTRDSKEFQLEVHIITVLAGILMLKEKPIF